MATDCECQYDSIDLGRLNHHMKHPGDAAVMYAAVCWGGDGAGLCCSTLLGKSNWRCPVTALLFVDVDVDSLSLLLDACYWL